eukprot:scaffold435066_cov18-Prasinocladus_malaysianus.AAC.1
MLLDQYGDMCAYVPLNHHMILSLYHLLDAVLSCGREDGASTKYIIILCHNLLAALKGCDQAANHQITIISHFEGDASPRLKLGPSQLPIQVVAEKSEDDARG